MVKPIVIGSERSEIGLPQAKQILAEGGAALDAVEAAMRRCEDNLADPYVGTGGLPNVRGEVELDASLMVGSTRAFGAVGAVRSYPNPISIARAVLERLPQHALLVGEGAELFARECGFEAAELLTDESRELYRSLLMDVHVPVEGASPEDAATSRDDAYRAAARDLVDRLGPPTGTWGTINIIALDSSGELCSGVSTSGYPYKYPGRVGDSAICGAGNYCDVTAGAAACTGRGEMTMRTAAAKSIVELLRSGAEPGAACAAVLADVGTLTDPFVGEVRAIAMTPDGRHGGAAWLRGGYYVMQNADLETPVEIARV